MADIIEDVSAEEAAIWNQDEDPTFEELRASLPDEPNEDVIDDEPVIEEDTVNTMEQPDDTNPITDSDIDAVDDVTPETPTEDVIEEDNQPDNVVVEDETDEADTVQTFAVKANGMDFNFTNGELVALAPKAMDYTKKLQEIAPYRKSISALKEAGLTNDDLNLAIDVLKGDKTAMAEVMKRTGVDNYALDELDEDAQYVPTQYGKDEHQLAIEDVVKEISIDPEYQITQQVVDTAWDSKSREVLAEQPQLIGGLHNDIKSGVYDKVAPMAFKMKALDGGTKSDIEYYMEAGQQYFAQQDEQNTQNDELTNTANEVNSVKQKAQQDANKSKSRKAASITKSNAGKRNVINYLDDNDEDYDAWYKKTMDNA